MNRPGLPELARRGEVHFMGVGGAGMCALAELLLRTGGTVSGCDLDPGSTTEKLAALGARILEGHGPDHVSDAVALVISSAIPGDHPEIARARSLDIPVLKRAAALGEWVNRSRVVAVAGTHGKTTTTAMATRILTEAGLEPTGFVGGRVPGWNGNLHLGSPDLFVVEADEYDHSFHTLEPHVAVVTNLEADHLDVYESLEGVRDAFRIFLSAVPDGGRAVLCGDDSGASALAPALGGRAYTYGFSPGCQLRGQAVRLLPGGSALEVLEDGRTVGSVTVGVPGLHNVLNALGAAAAARHLGAEWGHIRAALAGFEGVARRFQRLGEVSGVAVVDDYAHHPTEVEATLIAARTAFPGRRIVAVFQPHLFTRTRDFAASFGRVLGRADVVWVTDVYPAREDPIQGVDGSLVADAVPSDAVDQLHYHAELDSLPSALASFLAPGDVCLTMGAGSVEHVGPGLLDLLKEGEGAHV